ncbi:hypothetical protein COCMIDRAFT_23965 [Bipolaris oryzae ATCC 44560]|uniref:Uncharacterized protein n=1 Tax=Bipolaris oryzae ATCC 44560 TaxID=930090 RepID=W6ZWR5_COCMI|nr:uncharacterized protein COCMIDRAFT_23965 [Bipolaris oryzae ATCC 44560]EUC48251.1 hypothetical protein COCMIDRAFT_23965 [Bipolaris oryzae ATCC 44560]
MAPGPKPRPGWLCNIIVDGIASTQRADSGCGAAGPARRRGAVCLFLLSRQIYQSIHISHSSSMAMLSSSWKKTGVALAGWRCSTLRLHSALTMAWPHSAPCHLSQQQPVSTIYLASIQLSLPFPPPSPPRSWLGLPAIAARDSRARYTCPPWHGPFCTFTLAPLHRISPLVCTSPSNVKRRRKRSRQVPGTGVCTLAGVYCACVVCTSCGLVADAGPGATAAPFSPCAIPSSFNLLQDRHPLRPVSLPFCTTPALLSDAVTRESEPNCPRLFSRAYHTPRLMASEVELQYAYASLRLLSTSHTF